MFRRGFLPSISSLMAFDAVARHGTVSRAAEHLNLTQSAVSRSLMQLETSLGIRLFRRSRQRLILTEAGQAYVEDVRSALRALSDATHDAIVRHDSRTLRIAVVPTFGARWLVPRLMDFSKTCPDVTVHLNVRLQQFDFAAERFDASIYFGMPDWPGAVCEFLMREECVPVAALRTRSA